MPIVNTKSVIAMHNGKPVRGIYRQEIGTFEAQKGVVKIVVTEYEYSFDFTVNGKRYRSVFGRESEFGKIGATGKWESQALEAAVTALVRFKANAKNGTGPTSISEENKIAADEQEMKESAVRAERVEAEKKLAEEKRRNTSIAEFFETTYLPQAEHDKKPDTWKTEERLFRHWISPVVGTLPFDQISIEHLNQIKRNMASGKRGPALNHSRDKQKKSQEKRNPARPMSPKSINYAISLIRQIWNLACAVKPPLALGAWPGSVKAFKKPKFDNQRKRFLSKNEAATLLAALHEKSKDLHDMALLSLHCGLRASEIFNLTWDKVHLAKGELLLVDTKNGESRISYLTDQTKEMLRQRSFSCQHQRYVFVTKTNRKGHPVSTYTQVPVTFSRTVKELGLNDGVIDPRDKIVFHSLRHTFASWLVENGASLPIVRDLMGHKNLIMTSRYSHVSAEAQKNAVNALNQSLKPRGENIIHLQPRKKLDS